MTDAGELTTSNSSATSVSNVTMSNGNCLDIRWHLRGEIGGGADRGQRRQRPVNNGATISVDAGAAMTVGAASVVYQDTNNSVAGGSPSPGP